MSTIRRVLFPTRFEILSLSHIGTLLPLRVAGLEEVVLLFVVDEEEVASLPLAGSDADRVGQLAEGARLKFDGWRSELEQTGLRCRTLVEFGRPSDKILEIAAREKVDLIVTGRQRHMPADAVYLGGTAMDVLRKAEVPVLVLKPPPLEAAAREDTECFDRILCPTDLTEVGGSALKFLWAVREAARRVRVLHVIPESRFSAASFREREDAQRECHLRLDAICAYLRTVGFLAEPHLRIGGVVEHIHEEVAAYRATVICMATTGRRGLKELWLGSISHRVAELAPVPVVLVPA